MLAGLRRVPKFEEILGNGETYTLDERLAYNTKPTTAYREGFFHVGQNDLADAEYNTKHEDVRGAPGPDTKVKDKREDVQDTPRSS